MRAGIIEQVMCNFSADFGQIARRFGFDVAVLIDSLQRLQPLVDAGLACVSGSTVCVPKQHRLFLRSVASAFDSSFTGAKNRHSLAI